ncbi:MAG: hypothetical protein K0S04_1416 [Herbinix sp.]|jgi:stage II sporulation protein R|nr:hypothetical protein [Herbinix sp.]
MRKLISHIKSIHKRNAFNHNRSNIESLSIESTNHTYHRHLSDKPKFRLWLLLLIISLCSLSSFAIRANAQHNQKLQLGIAHEIIRFHVLANSDSDEDQQLKLKVKGDVVEALAPILKDATTVAEARGLLSSNMELIKSTALKTIHENGYSYPVSVTLENTYFPLKIYGEFTFPPGTYEALRVQIGEAKGQNWWCVMFPQLCFIDSTYSIVDKESEKKLQRLLTDEEYESLLDKKTPVKVKFKILEEIRDLFS